MSRRYPVPVLALIPLVLSACARDVGPPQGTERPGLFTLETSLGPVDVLDVIEEPGGIRNLRLHAELPDGRHAVRDLRISLEDHPAGPGPVRVSYALLSEGTERLRLVRTDAEAGWTESILQTPGERMRLRASAHDGVIQFLAECARGNVTRIWEAHLIPGRASEPAYVNGVREALASFYGAGPLRDDGDLALLGAVLESPSWESLPGRGTLLPSTLDEETRRRIQRVCAGAAVASKISCFISRFTPWGMIVCVPSTGISIACLIYNVAQLFTHPDPTPPPRPCTCGCGCSD